MFHWLFIHFFVNYRVWKTRNCCFLQWNKSPPLLPGPTPSAPSSKYYWKRVWALLCFHWRKLTEFCWKIQCHPEMTKDFDQAVKITKGNVEYCEIRQENTRFLKNFKKILSLLIKISMENWRFHNITPNFYTIFRFGGGNFPPVPPSLRHWYK